MAEVSEGNCEELQMLGGPGYRLTPANTVRTVPTRGPAFTPGAATVTGPRGSGRVSPSAPPSEVVNQTGRTSFRA